jgi:anti-anti-sigma regulatory factor
MDLIDRPGSAGRLLEIRGPDELTAASAQSFADAVARGLDGSAAVLWLNLERAKIVDVVALAVVAQAVERCRARGVGCVIFPSAAVQRGFARAGLARRVPVDHRRAGARREADDVVEVEPTAPPEMRSRDGKVRLAPPTWDDLRWLEGWAQDARLARLVGSEMLQMVEHFGPYDPDVAPEVLTSPTALVFLIHGDNDPRPIGFVRLYNINLGQGFAFLETVVADARGRRGAWGVLASRLLSGFAVETLGLHRIETKVYVDNVVSINALRRHGFTLEGRLREAYLQDGQRSDILVFGILGPEVRRRLTEEQVPSVTFWPVLA